LEAHVLAGLGLAVVVRVDVDRALARRRARVQAVALEPGTALGVALAGLTVHPVGTGVLRVAGASTVFAEELLAGLGVAGAVSSVTPRRHVSLGAASEGQQSETYEGNGVS